MGRLNAPFLNVLAQSNKIVAIYSSNELTTLILSPHAVNQIEAPLNLELCLGFPLEDIHENMGGVVVEVSDLRQACK